MSVLRRRTSPGAGGIRRGVDDARMSLFEHLAELRSRLVKSSIAIVICVIVAFILFPQIFKWLQKPYCQLPAATRRGGAGGGECTLYYFGVLDGFLVRMQVALIVGLLMSAPIWLYQLAAFVTPGLHTRERKWAAPFVLVSVLLFLAGGAFAYLTLDQGLRFLLGISGSQIVPILDVKKYLSFFTLMLLAFGVSFEFPVVIVFLELVGVVDAAKLIRWRRGMYFGLAAFSAIITPSQDPFTFFAMWIPLCLFYEASIVFARIHGRAKRRKRAGEGGGTDQWADDETSPLDDEEPVAGHAPGPG